MVAMSITLESSLEGLENGDLLRGNLVPVNSAQKFFTYVGYYANAFARGSVRSIERLTRPIREDHSYWGEAAEKVKAVVSSVFSVPLAAFLLVPAFVCYVLASCIGGGRFEFLKPESRANFWQERSVKVVSLNACFQDPWSPFTGGVVPPLEPVSDHATRVAAVVNAIAQENPVVYMGQEFDSLAAQDESIRLMQEKGFRYFLRDLGSNDPVRNHSGLFVASKVPLENVEFVPYPLEDRAGLAKWSGQGALTFTIRVQEQELRLINVHLNYGQSKEDQEARNRQLKRHVVPLLERGDAVLFVDFNFNTALVDPAVSGLSGFTNALEGRVTCTDAGKHALRGKSLNPGGKPCTDCEERIDGLVYNPNRIEVLGCEVKPLVIGEKMGTDHYLTSATVQIRD